MVKVWISGAWTHKDEMREKIDEVRQLGYEITHDWTTNERTHDSDEKELGEYARLDIDGVLLSDIAVAVMDNADYTYRGTYTEIGCALGVGKPLHIVCPFNGSAYLQNNVFYWHPSITHHKSWEQFVVYLMENYPTEE
jgi:nucleoside 2-deoxyribosyltransferase